MIITTLAVSVALVPFVSRVVIDPSMERVIDQDHPDKILLDEVQNDFGSDNTLFILLQGSDFFSSSSLKAIDRITRLIETIQGVRRVVSLSNVMRIRGSEEGIDVSPLIDMDRLDPDFLDEARTYALSNSLYHRNLVSTDCRTTSINIFLRSMTDLEYYELEIGNKIEWILETEARDIKTFIAGVPYMKQTITKFMKQDLFHLTPITFLLVTAILMIAFRSIRGMVLPMLTVSLSLGWTVGLMGLIGEPMTLISSVLPALLMAVGSAYGIHILAEHKDQSASGDNSRSISVRTMEKVGLPVLLTGLTTIVGFLSLGVSGIPAIRALGFFSAFGIFSAMVVSLTLLPALLTIVGPGRTAQARQASERSRHLLKSLGQFDVRKRWTILAFSMVLIVLGSSGIGHLEVDFDVMSFFKADSFLHEIKRVFHEELAGTAPLFLVIEGDEPDSVKDPRLLARIEDLQAFLNRFDEIDATLSVADYIKLMNRAVEGDDPASERIPTTKREVAEELLLLAMSDVAEELEGYVDHDYSTANILLRTDLASSAASREVIFKIDQYLKEHFPPPLKAKVTGTLILFNRTADSLAVAQVKSLAVAIGTIFVMMTFLFRSIRLGLLSMVPNLIPILLFFGIMGWTGVALNLNTSVIACVVLGIAVDDTIHLLSRYRKARKESDDPHRSILTGIEEVGRPLITTTVTLCLGFSVFTFSTFHPVVEFGALSAVTLAICLVADLIPFPALLAIVDRSRGTKLRKKLNDELSSIE